MAAQLPSTGDDEAAAASGGHWLVPDKPYTAMSRDEKLKVVYAQLDRHRAG